MIFWKQTLSFEKTRKILTYEMHYAFKFNPLSAGDFFINSVNHYKQQTDP